MTEISRSVFGAVQDQQELIVLAMKTAISKSILSLPGPESFHNYSYGLQFYGPTVKCSEADSSLLPSFQVYSDAYYNNMKTMTTFSESSQNIDWTNVVTPIMLLFSSFSPTIGSSLVERQSSGSHNWNATISTDNVSVDLGRFAQQWIQTADRSIVCTLANASFTISVNSTNEIQTVNQSVDVINMVADMSEHEGDSDIYKDINTLILYNSWFSAMNSLLSGSFSFTTL